MKRHGRTAFVWCATGGAAIALGASCRDPTEIVVSVTTTQSCGDFGGVAITVGPDVLTTQTNFEQHYVNATTSGCADATGLVGTLVLTPGNTTGSLLVAGGVRKPDGTLQDPSQCGGGTEVAGDGGSLTDTNSAYCIIARRTFAFVDHTPLTLPIPLDPRCIGRDCTPGSTCYQGTCVSDNVVCSGGECGLAEENPGQNTGENDANGSGVGDGNPSSSSDGSYDAAVDSPSSEDGSTDGSPATGQDSGYGAPACSTTTYQPPSTYVGTCDIASGAGVGFGNCPGSADSATCCECACIYNGTFEKYAVCNATSGSCPGTCSALPP